MYQELYKNCLRVNRSFILTLWMICFAVLVMSGCGGGGGSDAGDNDQGIVIRVPDEYATIQGAVSAASAGTVILVAPGIYRENIRISAPVTLASQYYTSSNDADISNTIIDGGGLAVVEVFSVSGTTSLIGLTIRNGEDGIRTDSDMQISNNIITGNNDGIDFEGGGGEITNNRIFGNRDDGVDLDGASFPTISGNDIRDNEDDGIEIRLHDYFGSLLVIDIHNNTIISNASDGIQLIDYPGKTSREFMIRRNVIANNSLAGIGFMPNGNTVEDFSAAAIEERVNIINNTITGNDHGLSGGGSAIVINNIFLNNSALGAKDVNGDSVIAYSLFWNNGIDSVNSILDNTTLLFIDPQLQIDYSPSPGSPVIDAGAANYVHGMEVVLSLDSDQYSGSSPDVGAIEGD